MAANRHLVAALRDALVERHELIGTEITDILQAAAAAGPAEEPAAWPDLAGDPVAEHVIDLRDDAVTVADDGVRDAR